jgi:hypothetical protein
VLAALAAAGPLRAQAPVVDSVAIVRDDVFQQGEFGFVGRAMNALHVVTRERVVRREVLLRPGMPFDSALAAETARNLRRLGVFRRVLLDTLRVDGRLVLRVHTQDGWSSSLIFDINSAAGETAFAIGFADANFLGTAAQAGARYRTTPDRTSWLLAYRHPRLIANRIGVTTQLDLRSDGEVGYFGVGQPFFSLSSRNAWNADVAIYDGDVRRFLDGNPVPFVILLRRYFLGRVDLAHAFAASPRGYLRGGVLGQVRRDDYVPQPVTDTTPFPTTWTGAAGPYVEWSRARFAVLRNITSFLREEDQSIGITTRLGVLAAPKAFGYASNGLGLAVSGSAGTRVPLGLVRVDAVLTTVVDGEGVDSGTAVVRGRVLLQPGPRHGIVAGGFVGWQKNQAPGAEFDLGLAYGLRAYPLHAFTGDRGWLAAVEYRFTLTDHLWNVFGLAVGGFVESGGAWYAGSPSRGGTDLGVGIRFGPSRLSSGDMFRVDAAYRLERSGFDAGWSLVLGRGLSF